jgi:hypothetical protein
MELFGFEVEVGAPTDADRATDAGRWFLDAFGVVPRLTALVGDLDAAVAELVARRIDAVPFETGEDASSAVRVAGPAGLAVDVVQPAPAGHYEEAIGSFISSAADLAGPPTDDLADAVNDIVAAAWREIERRLDGVAHNKVLATHLLLSQRSRGIDPRDEAYWQASAASTLLSGFVGRGATS